MADKSKIEWCDATWNPVRGCTKVSPGCRSCYAEVFAERFRGVKGHPYEQGFDLRLVSEKLTEPLSWKKPRRVFVNSMSDLFQDGVPEDYIDRVFAVMALTPQHTYQVLTKRAERMRAYLSDASVGFRIGSELMPIAIGHASSEAVVLDIVHRLSVKRQPLPNVWLGVSVENQHFADERIPLLLQTPAAVRFISAEPLLGPVDIEPFVRDQLQPGHVWRECCCDEIDPADRPCVVCWARTGLDWVIVGGESGPGARAFDLLWARSIVQQCQAAGVPVFVKQLGANPIQLDGDHVPFSSRKGGEPSEWPEDLRVRQFPEVRA